MNHELFVCDCDDVNDQIIFSDDGEMIWCSVHLAPDHSFKNRIIKAIKYIFNHKETYGHFNTFLFKNEDADKLQKIVDKLREYGEKNN